MTEWDAKAVDKLLRGIATTDKYRLPKKLNRRQLAEELSFATTWFRVRTEMGSSAISKKRFAALRRISKLGCKLWHTIDRDADFLLWHLDDAFPSDAALLVQEHQGAAIGFGFLHFNLGRLVVAAEMAAQEREASGWHVSAVMNSKEENHTQNLVRRLAQIAETRLRMKPGVGRSLSGRVDSPFVRFCEGYGLETGINLKGETIAKALRHRRATLEKAKKLPTYFPTSKARK